MIRLNLKDYESPVAENYHVEYWYDRHERYWVVQVFDNFDRQTESECCPNKEWRDSTIKEFSDKYNTKDVRKV